MKFATPVSPITQVFKATPLTCSQLSPILFSNKMELDFYTSESKFKDCSSSIPPPLPDPGTPVLPAPPCQVPNPSVHTTRSCRHSSTHSSGSPHLMASNCCFSKKENNFIKWSKSVVNCTIGASIFLVMSENTSCSPCWIISMLTTAVSQSELVPSSRLVVQTPNTQEPPPFFHWVATPPALSFSPAGPNTVWACAPSPTRCRSPQWPPPFSEQCHHPIWWQLHTRSSLNRPGKPQHSHTYFPPKPSVSLRSPSACIPSLHLATVMHLPHVSSS